MSQASARGFVHAAVFRTNDPAERTALLVSGSIDTVRANVPAGGCWRAVPAGVTHAGDVPPLGELA